MNANKINKKFKNFDKVSDFSCLNLLELQRLYENFLNKNGSMKVNFSEFSAYVYSECPDFVHNRQTLN